MERTSKQWCQLPSRHLRYFGREIMSGPELKKRHVQGVNTSTMETPATRPTPKARTVTWDEIPEWQRDNKYILSGYRPEKADYYVMFRIFFCCAEGCLIFSATSHLVGPHSPAVEEFWHQMDLLGIVIVTVGTFTYTRHLLYLHL